MFTFCGEVEAERRTDGIPRASAEHYLRDVDVGYERGGEADATSSQGWSSQVVRINAI